MLWKRIIPFKRKILKSRYFYTYQQTITIQICRSTKQFYENKMTELHNNYADKMKALMAENEAKTEINRKWATETRIIKDSLEKLIADLKIEIDKLKKENKKLKEKLLECNNKVEQYKTFMDLISKDVNKISTMAMECGDIT